MKKVILLGMVVIGMVSCTKEYTCKCTSTFEDGSTNFETEDYFNISESHELNNVPLSECACSRELVKKILKRWSSVGL